MKKFCNYFLKFIGYFITGYVCCSLALLGAILAMFAFPILFLFLGMQKLYSFLLDFDDKTEDYFKQIDEIIDRFF